MTRKVPAVADVAEPALTVAAVARRLGVAPATLRTWDRRYGLGPTQHEPGAHRRYSSTDVARLEHMHRLLLDGVSAGDAARAAGALDPSAGDAAIAPVPVAASAPSRRRGGGRVLPLPDGPDEAHGLARAAQALDHGACLEVLQRSLDARGPVWTWDNVILPVLISVGRKWSATGRNVEVEHVLSGAVRQALTAYVRSADLPATGGVVMLACVPDEMHSLPLDAVAAGLAERGIGSRVMGASLPGAALVDAARKLRPNVIFLWSQAATTAAVNLLGELPRFRQPSTVVLGGLGWAGALSELPTDVQVASDLSDAVARLSRSVAR